MYTGGEKGGLDPWRLKETKNLLLPFLLMSLGKDIPQRPVKPKRQQFHSTSVKEVIQDDPVGQ